MSYSEIVSFLKTSEAKTVVLLCHHNADPDAICSAFAFASLLKYSLPQLQVEIGASHGISRLSKHLIQNLPIEVNNHPSIEKADAFVLLDTNTIQQLDILADRVKNSKAPIIVIDHHASHPETEQLARICISNEEASSTSEIVFNFYKEMGLKPREKEAKAIFLGITFDTRHFILANSKTFKTIAELVDAGVNAQETLSLLALPMDFSERVARLKASKRTRLFRVKDWIVALSHVSAYQASAARAMIDLGAHVSAVAGEKNGILEISLRSSLEFYKRTNIHLGKDVAKPLGEYIHGMGGGHATAAGVNGVGDIEIGLKRALWLLKERLISHN